MQKMKLLVFVLLSACLVQGALAQSTDDCTFQPSLDESDSGDIGPFLAFPIGATDSFLISVGNSDCRNGPSPQTDSVWCFTPNDDCMPTIRLTDSNGAGENLILNLFTGPCSSSLGALECVDSVAAPTPGLDVVVL